MKSGLIVVGVLLAISVGIAFMLKQHIGPEYARTQDLVTGLAYWLESHDGEFPPSKEAFLKAPFIEPKPDGGFVVRAKADSRYRRETNGIEIYDLTPFKVAWGTNLVDLTVDEGGTARGKSGQIVELVCWPSSPPSGKGYTAFLLDVSNQCRSATSRPAP